MWTLQPPTHTYTYTHALFYTLPAGVFCGKSLWWQQNGGRREGLYTFYKTYCEGRNKKQIPPYPPHSTRQRNKTNSLGMMSHYSACWKFLKHFVLLFHLLSSSSSFFHLLILPSHHVLLLPLVFCICFNVFFLHISFVVIFGLLLLLFDFLLYRHPVYFSFLLLLFFFFIVIFIFFLVFWYLFIFCSTCGSFCW